MAVVCGYGGLANTNGARDFSTKVEAAVVVGASRSSIGISIGIHGFALMIARILTGWY